MYINKTQQISVWTGSCDGNLVKQVNGSYINDIDWYSHYNCHSYSHYNCHSYSGDWMNHYYLLPGSI